MRVLFLFALVMTVSLNLTAQQHAPSTNPPTPTGAAEPSRYLGVDWARAELKKRWNWVEVWLNPAAYSRQFKDPDFAREFRVQRGEILMLIREHLRIFLSPEHAGQLAYEILGKDNDHPGKMVRVYIGNPPERLADLYIDSERKTMSPSISLKRVTEFGLARERADNAYPTLPDTLRAEMSYLSDRVSARGYKTFEDEGQIELLAKALFGERNTTTPVLSQFIDGRHYHRNAVFIVFKEKGTQRLIGTVAFNYDANGKAVVRSIPANGDFRTLLQNPNPTPSFPDLIR